jgi:Mg-chelatase subunit ChlD
MPDSEQPCLKLGVAIIDNNGDPLEISARNLETQIQNDLEIIEDNVRISRFIVEIDGKDTTNAAPYQTYTIILVDHSGSMFNENTEDGKRKFDAAMGACRQFANDFRNGVDHTAVIPFSSHDVSKTVLNTPFMSSKRELLAQIDHCSAVIGNTGLYTAMTAALARLNKKQMEIKKRDNVEPRCLLVVLTDGENYVDPVKDDRDLIDDSNAVREMEYGAGIQVITIGFGRAENFDEDVLKRLAWPDDASYRKASYGSDLIQAFVAARRFLLYRIQIFFLPHEKHRAQFVTQKSFVIRLRVNDPDLLIESSFIFPEISPGRVSPSFEQEIGTAERGQLSEGQRGLQESFLFKYGLIFLSFCILFMFLWFIIPRRLWRRDFEASILKKEIEDILRERGVEAPSHEDGPRSRSNT